MSHKKINTNWGNIELYHIYIFFLFIYFNRNSCYHLTLLNNYCLPKKTRYLSKDTCPCFFTPQLILIRNYTVMKQKIKLLFTKQAVLLIKVCQLSGDEKETRCKKFPKYRKHIIPTCVQFIFNKHAATSSILLIRRQK